MSDRFDQILKQALAPDQTPDLRLNQKILNQVKEREEMKKRRKWKMGSRNCVFFCTSAGGGIRSGLCGLQTADAGTDGGKNRG